MSHPQNKLESMKPHIKKLIRCGDVQCCVSTGIHGGLTFGKGKLDWNGYWEFPCDFCQEL